MKKFFAYSLIGWAILGTGFLMVSCTSNLPSKPNFQSPVQTIEAINPTFTPTSTSTPTSTPTITPTSTITGTSTPYVSNSWVAVNGVNGPVSFSHPKAILSDGSGNFFIADTGNNQVEKCDSNFNLMSAWGDNGKGKGIVSYSNPLGLALDGSGYLYVVGNSGGVTKYDNTGNYITQFTATNGVTYSGVAVDGGGNVYVSDQTNHRVVQFNGSYGIGSGFGGSGSISLASPVTLAAAPSFSPVTISSPITLSGIAMDHTNSSLYVATQGKGVNTQNYSWVLSFDIVSGQATTVIDGFNNPTGLVFDAFNNLYVANTGAGLVEEFLGTNLLVPVINFNGNGLLSMPVGVAVDGTSRIFVADANANKIFMFTN